MSAMSKELTSFFAKLNKDDFLTILKSAIKNHDVKSLLAKLKEKDLEMPEDLASELLEQLSGPLDDNLLGKLAAGYYPGMDELDWKYFSQHPEYGVGLSR